MDNVIHAAFADGKTDFDRTNQALQSTIKYASTVEVISDVAVALATIAAVCVFVAGMAIDPGLPKEQFGKALIGMGSVIVAGGIVSRVAKFIKQKPGNKLAFNRQNQTQIYMGFVNKHLQKA